MQAYSTGLPDYNSMITVIHGEDIVASRKHFLSLVQKEKNPAIFDYQQVTKTDLMQILEGGSLFEENISLFIEDLFSKRKPSKEFEEIVEYLKISYDKGDIILWESKELTNKTTSLFPKATTTHFPLSKTLFTFLNSIKPGNTKKLITLFHKTLETTEAELVFFMLIRQFRLLLAVSDHIDSIIDETQRLAPWQKNTLEKQAQLFSQDKLKELYRKLYVIDLGQKTGMPGTNMTQAIDFFLLDI